MNTLLGLQRRGDATINEVCLGAVEFFLCVCVQHLEHEFVQSERRCVESSEWRRWERKSGDDKNVRDKGVTRSVRRSTQGECQNKHVTSRRFTHGTVVESMADSARDQVHHLHACRVRCVRSCMDFTRCVENVEARRVRVNHNIIFVCANGGGVQFARLRMAFVLRVTHSCSSNSATSGSHCSPWTPTASYALWVFNVGWGRFLRTAHRNYQSNVHCVRSFSFPVVKDVRPISSGWTGYRGDMCWHHPACICPFVFG